MRKRSRNMGVMVGQADYWIDPGETDRRRCDIRVAERMRERAPTTTSAEWAVARPMAAWRRRCSPSVRACSTSLGPKHPGSSYASPAGQCDRPGAACHFKMLTARAITRPSTERQAVACTAIASLAQRASGMTSVGLNAVALVKAR